MTAEAKLQRQQEEKRRRSVDDLFQAVTPKMAIEGGGNPDGNGTQAPADGGAGGGTEPRSGGAPEAQAVTHGLKPAQVDDKEEDEKEPPRQYRGARRGRKHAISFKVSAEEYEVYRLYTKYVGVERLLEKWRAELREIGSRYGDTLRRMDDAVRRELGSVQ